MPSGDFSFFSFFFRPVVRRLKRLHAHLWNESTSIQIQNLLGLFCKGEIEKEEDEEERIISTRK